MRTMDKRIWLGAGTVLAAIGASLCCILPIAVVILGFGSAALASQLEPFRPFLVGLTVVLLGIAFYQAYKPKKTECAPGESCAVPEQQRRRKIVVWIIAVLALALVTFPYYAGRLF